MKILLVVSQSGITKSAVRLIYPPLNLQQIAALTPPEHKVDVIDEGFSTIDLKKNYDYDLVGISCNTRNAFRAYDIADQFRKQGKTVVLGGYHPSALPEEAKQHADSVVVGEADETWPLLIKDQEKNQLKSFYFQNTPIDGEKIIAPRREITKNFYFLSVLQASRGCPMGCDFCAITNQKFGRLFRPRPIKDVIDEIKSLKRKGFSFHDPSLTIDLNFTKSLFKEMAGLNKKFICYGNINVLGKDDELLQLASEAGCIGWSIGFDSLSQDSLNSIRKTSNKVLEFI
ncbi:MAG: B12-binding domain-containing radical SAM protein [Thermoplasmatales archaeon]|nr:MAG: B12-binding domain-containing radical SAM protein [Thermoplasmatales archaeon]